MQRGKGQDMSRKATEPDEKHPHMPCQEVWTPSQRIGEF